jgi:hypothetical protein
MQYAQIDRETNLMKDKPVNLPNRWTTPEGATINYFNKLSKQTLRAFNWLPVVYEELTDGATHSLTSKYDVVNARFLYESIPQNMSILLKESKRRIDEAASITCSKYISQGAGQECRYMIKREQAINFLNDLEPNIVDYPMIQKESIASSRTAKELAQLILNTAEIWIDLAAEIEAARVGGKKKCSESKDVAEMIKYRDEAIATLELI